MTDERRAHQCHKTGCTSQATSGVDLHVQCPAPGMVTRLASMHGTLKVCDKHMSDVRGYLLSDQNREIIRTKLMEAGFPEPDFLSARIDYVPIEPEPVEVSTVVPCDRHGCSNPAHWQVVQHFRDKAKGKILMAPTNLMVCHKHKRELKPRHLLQGPDRAHTEAMVTRKGLSVDAVKEMLLQFQPIAKEVANG